MTIMFYIVAALAVVNACGPEHVPSRKRTSAERLANFVYAAILMVMGANI